MHAEPSIRRPRAGGASVAADGRRRGDAGLDSRPQLLFFYRRTSGLCRRVEAYLAQVLQRHRNHDAFRVIRVPLDERADLAEAFAVEEVPTLVVIDDHEIRARLDAPRGRPAIEAALSPWLR